MVEQCLKHKTRAYVAQWEEPPPGFGLEDYGERLLLACADAIRTETGERAIFLFGHSLGGLFAALFAALHPERVRGLLAAAAPFHFGFTPQEGVLGPVLAAISRAGLLDGMPKNVPGSFLSLASFIASPTAFGSERLLDWLRCWPDAGALANHLRVERWTLDELPLAGRLVLEITQRLYAEDSFLRGTLMFHRDLVAARNVVAPLLLVADERCPVVPLRAILPFADAAGAADKQLLWYPGDVGVALRHVGMLVGAHAQRELWPRILRWVHARHAGDARVAGARKVFAPSAGDRPE